jgi:phosphomevalonate kinase
MTPNPFVEATLTYVLTYINKCLHLRQSHSLTSAHLTILADNDYYSHDPTRTDRGRFASFHTTISKAPKTGLGSSAALVTALTGALLSHYLPDSFTLGSADGKRTLHNLAQIAHGAAQGKIGSGFDVAAAVYGSCVYRRFSPEMLVDLPEPGAPGFASCLELLVNREWDGRIKDFALPEGIAVRMVDVHSGTQTVGMAKRVLEWRKKQPVRATELWWGLHGLNMFLEQQLRTPGGSLEHVAETIARCRAVIRTISAESGVPIEPPSQTELLDQISAVEGVYGGVVPGAGGHDAAAIVMKDDEGVLADVRRCCADFTKAHVKVDVMRVKAEMEGVRTEDTAVFEGWLTAP